MASPFWRNDSGSRLDRNVRRNITEWRLPGKTQEAPRRRAHVAERAGYPVLALLAVLATAVLGLVLRSALVAFTLPSPAPLMVTS